MTRYISCKPRGGMIDIFSLILTDETDTNVTFGNLIIEFLFNIV
jgi:hypothetical protein